MYYAGIMLGAFSYVRTSACLHGLNKAMCIQSLIHNYNIRKNTLMSKCGHDHIYIYKLIKFHRLTLHYNMYIIVLTIAPLETNNCTTAD